jgi:hypothetical protein
MSLAAATVKALKLYHLDFPVLNEAPARYSGLSLQNSAAIYVARVRWRTKLQKTEAGVRAERRQVHTLTLACPKMVIRLVQRTPCLACTI